MKHLARYAQHDSHEYLQALLHAVGKALRTSSASANRRDKDIIEESFGGSVKNILVCSVCGETREKDEAFVNLSVEVGEMNRISPASSPSPAPRVSPNGSSNASNNNSNRSKTKTPEVIPPTTLQNCIATFTSPETIPTPLSCVKCKAKQVRNSCLFCIIIESVYAPRPSRLFYPHSSCQLQNINSSLRSSPVAGLQQTDQTAQSASQPGSSLEAFQKEQKAVEHGGVSCRS